MSLTPQSPDDMLLLRAAAQPDRLDEETRAVLVGGTKNVMRVTRRRVNLLIAIVLGAATACSDNMGPASTRNDSLPTLVGLTISAPVSAAAGGVRSLVAAPSGDAASVYVSLAPESVPSGVKARIRDLAIGQSIMVDVVHGGFDPVAISASIGDTLTVEVSRPPDQPIQAIDVVRPRRPPVVVRTDPPPRKRDVPLNTIIVIVFSEPIDASTLGTESVVLRRGTTSVPGTIRFADAAHIRVEFHPDALLAAQSDYELVLSQSIRAVSGAALGSDVTVPFTTGSIAPPANLEFVSVSVGGNHACAVTTAGAAYCWGDAGALPVGYPDGSLTPILVPGSLNFASVSAGPHLTCGVTTSGAAYCWSELNLGPMLVSGGLMFAHVSAGLLQSCGLTSGGAAYCWGDDLVPVQVGGGATFVSVSSGWRHSCGLTTDGALLCWGWNTDGQLGTGTANGPEQCYIGYGAYAACSTTPVAPSGGLTFASVSAAGLHTCGVTTNGAPYCWGNNLHGLLGDATNPTGPEECADERDRDVWEGDSGVYPCSRIPAAVLGGGNLSSVASSGDDWFACGLDSIGGAYCWGGDDFINHGESKPVAVEGGIAFATLSSGSHSACGLTVGRVLYCWGNNSFGQLGDGTTTTSTVPMRVAGQRPPVPTGAALQRVKVSSTTP